MQIEKKCDDVLKALDCCKQFVYVCDQCPYNGIAGDRDTLCVEQLHRDAMELIRELKRRSI